MEVGRFHCGKSNWKYESLWEPACVCSLAFALMLVFPRLPTPPTPPPHHHTALLQLSQQLSPQAIESKEFFPVLFCFVSLRNLMESQKYPSLF